MSKLKFTLPSMLLAYGSLLAMSALGTPIGLPLMLGAGLVVLGRSGVRGADAANPFAFEDARPAYYEAPEANSHHLSHTDHANDEGYTDYEDKESYEGEGLIGKEDIATDEAKISEHTLQPIQPNLVTSRKLLSPAYHVDNSASTGLNSFPEALAYVNSIGGTQNITFGNGTHNQTCVLTSNRAITTIIPLNLASLSPAGFTLDGGGGRYISSQVTTPTGFIFVSSQGNGAFVLYRSSFQNNAGGFMTTNVGDAATLSLSGSSAFVSNAQGNMTISVNDAGALSLSGSSRCTNFGSGSIIISVNDVATLSLSGDSRFTNFNPNNMTISVNDAGALSLSGRSYFLNLAEGNMTISVNGAATLYLSSNSYFLNNAQGNMTISVNDAATLSLSGGSYFLNDEEGTMLTNIGDEATLYLSSNSYFQNRDAGNMTTSIGDEATLSLSGGSYFLNDRAGTMLTNIYSGGLLSIDTGAIFYGSNVVVKANGTLSFGLGGSYFKGTSLALMPNSIFMAVIGSGSLPMQFMTCSTCTSRKASNATIEGALLNIVSYLPLLTLQGSNYTIITIAAGSIASGNFGPLQFNNSSINLPYELLYLPNSSHITSIIAKFLPSIFSPTHLPTTAEPSIALPSGEPTFDPTTIIPTTAFPSTIVPSTILPSWWPTLTPSTENPVTEHPVIEPSPFPTNIPTALATFLATFAPTQLIANLTNSTPNSTIPNSTLLSTEAPAIEPATDAPFSPLAAPASSPFVASPSPSPLATSSAEEESPIIYWLKIGGIAAGGVTALCLIICCAVKPIREKITACFKKSSSNNKMLDLWNKNTAHDLESENNRNENSEFSSYNRDRREISSNQHSILSSNIRGDEEWAKQVYMGIASPQSVLLSRTHHSLYQDKSHNWENNPMSEMDVNSQHYPAQMEMAAYRPVVGMGQEVSLE